MCYSARPSTGPGRRLKRRSESMPQTLIIPGRFPGLNEIIKAAKRSPYVYSEMKKEYSALVWASALEQRIRPVCSARFTFTWVEANRHRDLDNVAAAKKFLLDGLVDAGVIKTDGWAHVLGWVDVFKVDQRYPRVEVVIQEMKGE